MERVGLLLVSSFWSAGAGCASISSSMLDTERGRGDEWRARGSVEAFGVSSGECGLSGVGK